MRPSRPASVVSFVVFAVGALILSTAQAEPAETSSEAVGDDLAGMHLVDASGVRRQLGDLLDGHKLDGHNLDGHKATLFVFLGTECPVSQLSTPKMVDLDEDYREQGLAIIALDPNYQDTLTEIAALARKFDLPFPMLRDAQARVADRLGVTRTPEVVLLDAAGRIRYQGRIDNQYLYGARRADETATPLTDAIKAVLAGDEVPVPKTEPIGCLIGRKPDPTGEGTVTYSKQIAGIVNQHCVECHRPGAIAPFSLTDYEDVAPWAPMIQEVIHSGRMPPWLADPDHGTFRNDPSLSSKELRLFDAWVAAGCPKGDMSELPASPEFAEGWRIPQPDLIIPMAEEPFHVPAEGVVDYQYFRVDPGFTEDKYVVAAEPQPGNPNVVHHIIVHVVRPGRKKVRGVGIAIGYAPGMPPLSLSAGQALRIPADAILYFEVHYTPNGTATTDLSRVGFDFIPEEEVNQLVASRSVINHRFAIPPRDPSYEVQATRRIRKECWLVSMVPHMHFRGAAFTYEAIYPDGEREILLNVPCYDFNWQLRYRLAKPKHLPAGTKIHCTAVYNNSASNPANPDPSATVHWGQQSWEEMMIGFYMTIPEAPPVEASLPENQTS